MRHVVRAPDGTPLAATCVGKPLTPEAEDHLAELVRAALQLHAERDPDNLMGDRQVRAFHRIKKTPVPGCAREWCTRVADHDGRCYDSVGEPIPDTPTDPS